MFIHIFVYILAALLLSSCIYADTEDLNINNMIYFLLINDLTTSSVMVENLGNDFLNNFQTL